MLENIKKLFLQNEFISITLSNAEDVIDEYIDNKFLNRIGLTEVCIVLDVLNIKESDCKINSYIEQLGFKILNTKISYIKQYISFTYQIQIKKI